MTRLFVVLLAFVPFLLHSQILTAQGIDSLVEQLKKMPNDTNKVKQYASVSYNYSNIDPEKGVYYGEEALKLAGNLHWKKGQASAYTGIAINQAALGNSAGALESNLNAGKLYEELNDSVGIAAVLANAGLVYMEQGNYPEALDNFFEALQINEKLNSKASQAIINENIGNIYFRQKDYRKTEKYYERALKIHKELGNQAGLARLLGNTARVFDAEGNYEKALEHHFSALKANEALGNKYSIQINLANIGYVYSKIKNFDSALKYQLQALSLSEEIKLRNSIAVNLGNVGETYFMMASDHAPENLKKKRQHLTTAINYLEKAITICKETGFSGPQIEFSQFLSDAYNVVGNYEKAFKIYKEYTSLKDSVFSEENNLKLAELESNHELALKDKDIVIKDKQLEIASLAAANKNKERAIYISGIVLLFILAGILIGRSLLRIRRQRNALSEIARIQSHDVRGPVSKILGLTQLFNHEDTTDPVNKEVIKYISTTAVEMDEIINTVVNKTQAGK